MIMLTTVERFAVTDFPGEFPALDISKGKKIKKKQKQIAFKIFKPTLNRIAC